MQKSCAYISDLQVHKSPALLVIKRLVRDIAREFKRDLDFEGEAAMALQEAAEAFLVTMFTDAK